MRRQELKEQIIVYDFDKTVYGGETGTDFFIFYLKKNFIKSMIFFIFYIKDLFLYIIKRINLTELKSRFYKFLEHETLESVEKLVEEYWRLNDKKIYSWFYDEIKRNKQEADKIILISATPLFLIEKLALKLGFTNVFGTILAKKVIDGKEYYDTKIIGENCKNDIKVKVLNEWAKSISLDYEMIKFYSDSVADKPLFDLAKNKYWINNGKKTNGEPTRKKIYDKLFWR